MPVERSHVIVFADHRGDIDSLVDDRRNNCEVCTNGLHYTNYTICPLAILSRAAVEEVMAAKQAIDVKYISPSGVVSDTPLDGVNIEVTTFGDGSRSVNKRMAN